MIKKSFILLIICVSFLINISIVSAGDKIGGTECERTDPENGYCVNGYSCQPSKAIPSKYLCQPKKIGGVDCNKDDPENGYCVNGYSCQPSKAIPSKYLCQPNNISTAFGKIQAPDALKGLIGKDPTGASGISRFLSNLIALIYSLAAIVLIFMLIWGAFQWMTSGGDKEKIEAARNRIIHAIIGLILFAIAFAVIQVLGQFTGFKFFVGQK